jgi:hypothetical protein
VDSYVCLAPVCVLAVAERPTRDVCVGRGLEQADGDKEPQKEEEKGLMKKMLASFDDENSGEGNSPLERAGEAAFVRTCCRAMLQGHGCAEHSD